MTRLRRALAGSSGRHLGVLTMAHPVKDVHALDGPFPGDHVTAKICLATGLRVGGSPMKKTILVLATAAALPLATAWSTKTDVGMARDSQPLAEVKERQP